MSADTERDDFIPSTSRNQDIHRNSILRDCNLHTFELSQACFPFTENKYQHPVLGVLVLSKKCCDCDPRSVCRDEESLRRANVFLGWSGLERKRHAPPRLLRKRRE